MSERGVRANPRSDQRFADTPGAIVVPMGQKALLAELAAEELDTMMIKEYMRTHPGTYLLAESVEVVTEDDLAPELAELEVEEYVLSGGEVGPERIRLHTCSGHSHVLTYLAEREAAPRS